MSEKEKLEEAKRLYQTANADQKYVLESLFPELKESEDEWIEKIRKDIISYLNNRQIFSFAESSAAERWIAWLEKQPPVKFNDEKDERIRKELLESFKYQQRESRTDKEWFNGIKLSEVVAWLEHQGEQKPIDKVEPKFHKGEWIISNNKKSTYQVIEVKRGIYVIRDNADNHEYHIGIEECEKSGRLWTIADAKDGDALAYVTDEEDLWIMIYWSLYEPYEGHVHYHALLVNDEFSDKGTCCICINNLKPATKEQRDLLFSKMREAGYEWDENKKELRKIEKQGNKTEEYIFRPIAGSTIDNAARQAINKATNGENIVFSFNGFYMKIYKDTTIDNIINSYNDFCKKQCKPKWSEEQQ